MKAQNISKKQILTLLPDINLFQIQRVSIRMLQYDKNKQTFAVIYVPYKCLELAHVNNNRPSRQHYFPGQQQTFGKMNKPARAQSLNLAGPRRDSFGLRQYNIIIANTKQQLIKSVQVEDSSKTITAHHHKTKLMQWSNEFPKNAHHAI